MLGIHGPALTYATAPLQEVFSDAGFATAVLRYEHALLSVQEGLGLVPRGAAATLSGLRADGLDLSAAAEAALATSNPLAGLLAQIQAHSPYAHLGVTSHDAWDVAHVLQYRAAVALISADVRRAVERLADLAEAHADTPMVARTQGQAGVSSDIRN